MERWQVEKEDDLIKNIWLKNEKIMERWQVGGGSWFNQEWGL